MNMREEATPLRRDLEPKLGNPYAQETGEHTGRRTPTAQLARREPKWHRVGAPWGAGT